MRSQRRWLVVAACVVLSLGCASDDAAGERDGSGGQASGGRGATGGGGAGGRHEPLDGSLPESGIVDASTCTRGQVVYPSPGCGSEARPVCKGPDACAEGCEEGVCVTYACGCDGVTLGTCDEAFARPFRHFGACPDGG